MIAQAGFGDASGADTEVVSGELVPHPLGSSVLKKVLSRVVWGGAKLFLISLLENHTMPKQPGTCKGALYRLLFF